MQTPTPLLSIKLMSPWDLCFSNLQGWHRQDCGCRLGKLMGSRPCHATTLAFPAGSVPRGCAWSQQPLDPLYAHPTPPAPVATQPQAKIIAQEYSAVTGAVGTLAWSSPEMLLGARCTERSDIYSYGERVGCAFLVCHHSCHAGCGASSAACKRE